MAGAEALLQSKIIKWLKGHDLYVIKTHPGMGTPAGCPDVIALGRGRWIAIEVKASPSAPYQPGQEATLSYLSKKNMFVYRADPTNWPEIQRQIEEYFL